MALPYLDLLNTMADDEPRKAAMPVAKSTGSRGPAVTPTPTASGRGQQGPAQPAAPQPSQQGAYSNMTPEERSAALATRGKNGFYDDPIGKTVSTAADLYRNPVANPIGWAANQGGKLVNNQLGFDLGGYIQDPAGQALNDIGAPDLVQAIANPTGFATRTGVNANTGYGLNPAASIQGGIQAGKNLINDGTNVVNAVKDAPGFVEGLINKPAPVAGGGMPGGGPPGTGVNPSSPQLPPLETMERPGSYRSDQVAGDIRSLLDAERRQGPSQAEALLRKAVDRSAATSLGIAATARGGAGARERAGRLAVTSNIAAGSQASQDLAALRAQEDAAMRARQASLVNALAGNAQAGDARDLGYYSSDQARAGSRDIATANIASNEAEGARDREARAFEAEQQRQLTRAQFNANSSPGLLDDPASWLTEALTGRKLRTTRI